MSGRPVKHSLTLRGHPADSRRFEAAAAILHDFGVRSVCLMSNNPLKLLALQEHGITKRKSDTIVYVGITTVRDRSEFEDLEIKDESQPKR